LGKEDIGISTCRAIQIVPSWEVLSVADYTHYHERFDYEGLPDTGSAKG